MTPTLDALVRQLREAMDKAAHGHAWPDAFTVERALIMDVQDHETPWRGYTKARARYIALCSPANIATLLDALAAQAMTHEREVFDAMLAVARAQAERDTAVMKLAENEQLLTENYDESVKVIRRLEDRVLELEAQKETAKELSDD